MPEPLKPEDLYCKAETEAERLRLRTAVLSSYGAHVRAVARRLKVPPRCMEDAYQAGMLGLIGALNRFDPGRGATFWTCAFLAVRNEIQAWQDTGQYDRKSPNRGKAEKYEARRENLRDCRYYLPLGQKEPESAETPEHLVSMKEQLRILTETAAEMSPEDRDLLFSEDGRNHRTDHYKSLVAKVAARLRPVRGQDGPGRAVHDNRDTVRP